MSKFNLTVGDVLKRETFKHAKVVAGASGLNRQVQWSHILEIKEIDSFLNGGELILTTGVGLQLDTPKQFMYVRKLIEKEVACLCIEVGPFSEHISPLVITLADEKGFPIIIFEKVVKFIEITQDLHALMINRHHEMLSNIDRLSQKFSEFSLSSNGILKILQELHNVFGHDVLFITDDRKSYYYPLDAKDIDPFIHASINDISSLNHLEERFFIIKEKKFAVILVKGLNQIWGHLYLQVEGTVAEEFLFLVLDRAGLAIAQILLRNKMIEERKQNVEDELVRNLLTGRECDLEELQTYLPQASKNLYYRIFLIKLNETETNTSKDGENMKSQRALFIRSLFKRHGFFPAISINKKEIAIISSFISTEALKKEKMKFAQMIQFIKEINDSLLIDGARCTFGISSVYKEFSQVKNGYREANEVLKLHELNVLPSPFYEELGIYRILFLLKNNETLKTYINDHLGAIIDYDKETNSDLLTTLVTFLECQGSKKVTADRLFIVRQTLYHRLKKLEALLGENFMEPSNRLALEFAVKAHEFSQIEEFHQNGTH